MENKNTEDTLTLSNDVNDIKNDVKKQDKLIAVGKDIYTKSTKSNIDK